MFGRELELSLSVLLILTSSVLGDSDVRSLSGQELFLRGNEEATRGHYQAAEAFFRESIRLDPGHEDSLRNLGNCLIFQGKVEEASALLEDLLDRVPQNATVHNSLGICRMKDERFEEAIACFSKALEIDPKMSSAQANLEETVRLMILAHPEGPPSSKASEPDPVKRLEDLVARESLVQAHREAVQLQTRTRRAAEALAKLGLKCLYAGKPTEALAVVEKLVQCEGGGKLADYITGASKRMLGQVDEAIPLLERAYVACPGDRPPAIELGLAYETRGADGDLARARTCYERAETLAPQEPRPQILLGYLSNQEGRWEEAESRFKKALALDPDLIYAWQGLALCHYGRRDFKEAEHCLRKALEINPAFQEAQLNLGVTLYQMGQCEEGLRLVEPLVEDGALPIRVKARETALKMMSASAKEADTTTR